MPSRAPLPDDTRLSRDKIVTAALLLVDSEGLQALSMRRLGVELGVDPMAVYYYISSKEELLDAVVEAVMLEIDMTVDMSALDHEDALVIAATQYRKALQAHANAVPLLNERRPTTPIARRPVYALYMMWQEAGLTEPQSRAAMDVVAAAIRGTALSPRLSDEDFEFVIRAMVRGLLGHASDQRQTP